MPVEFRPTGTRAGVFWCKLTADNPQFVLIITDPKFDVCGIVGIWEARMLFMVVLLFSGRLSLLKTA
jgi:hypothetical protein